MQLYMITDRRLFAGDPDQAKSALLDRAMPWVQAGLRFLQVREKDLPCAELQQMTAYLRDAVAAIAHRRGLLPPAVLINVNNAQQIKVACRVGDGVHLPGDARPLATRVSEVRALWRADRPHPVISASCHTMTEIEEAREVGISLILFAPVFEKPIWSMAAPEQLLSGPLASAGTLRIPGPTARMETTIPGVGLTVLRQACVAAGPVPVFALGGVTLENAGKCLEAGAAGIAGIRLFAGDGWRKLIAP